MDIFQGIEVARVGEGRWRLSWDSAFSQTPVMVYAGAAPAAIDRRQPCAPPALGAIEIDGLGHLPRPYFELVPAAGPPLIVGPREVLLEGGVNFRDLGGYLAAAGRRVSWGRLFRSGHLSRLTPADQALLNTLDIRTVCDFRMAEERLNEEGALDCAPTVVTLGIAPGLKDRFFFHRLFAQTDDPAVIIEAVHEVMRSMVGDAIGRYAQLFDVLLAAPSGSILMNCSAGKERTGVGAALVLMALGVSRATVLYDFCLSRRYYPAALELPRALAKYAVAPRPGRDVNALMDPLLVTRASYLECVFAVIDARYGSEADFLQQALGVGPLERARLQQSFTQ